jgi:hypothetical protein
MGTEQVGNGKSKIESRKLTANGDSQHLVSYSLRSYFLSG